MTEDRFDFLHRLKAEKLQPTPAQLQLMLDTLSTAASKPGLMPNSVFVCEAWTSLEAWTPIIATSLEAYANAWVDLSPDDRRFSSLILISEMS